METVIQFRSVNVCWDEESRDSALAVKGIARRGLTVSVPSSLVDVLARRASESVYLLVTNFFVRAALVEVGIA